MAVSRTAQYVALYRALESIERRRQPLFRDPFAEIFLPASLRAAVVLARVPSAHAWLSRYADRCAPGARTSAIARTAFLDDLVRAGDCRQLVILGAGFDCRAHRLPELRQWKVFEVDRLETQTLKRERLRVRADARGDVVYVSVDFLRQEPFARLRDEGWNAAMPTLILWEGVTNYLTEGAVRGVLCEAARTAPGSIIAFTYVHAGALDGRGGFADAAQILANVAGLGEPWTFGLHPSEVAGFVSSCGLELCEDLSADEYRRRYLGDGEMPGYAFYRLAVARVR